MITCKLISEVVSGNYDIPLRDLYSQRRDVGLVLPRHMSWYLAKTLTSLSYPAIGRHMGGRDHTSILHGVRRIGDAVVNDPQILANYEALVRQINAIGGAAERNEALALQLGDLDPLETAAAVLDAPLHDVTPSLEEIRALCMGMRHYAAEYEIAAFKVSQHASDSLAWEAERKQLHKAIKLRDAVVPAAEKVVAAQRALKSAFDTSNERLARKALEAAVSNLQTVFERT